jgi:hypothetical protein
VQIPVDKSKARKYPNQKEYEEKIIFVHIYSTGFAVANVTRCVNSNMCVAHNCPFPNASSYSLPASFALAIIIPWISPIKNAFGGTRVVLHAGQWVAPGPLI